MGNGDATKCFEGITDFDVVRDCGYSSGSSTQRRLQSGNSDLFPKGSIADQIKEARSSIELEMKNMMVPIYDTLGIEHSGKGGIRSKCQNAKKNLFKLGTAQIADTKSSKAEHLDAGNSTRNLLGSNDDDALELRMNERFDRLDTNFHSLESKVEKRTTSIEESMKSVEGKLDQVAGIDTNLHSLETKMEKRMSSIEENMKSLEGKLLDQVAGIDTKVQSLERMEGKLDQLAELLIKLVGDFRLEEA